MYLGAVADDVTGGTDLASVLRRAGLDVVQMLDLPETVPRADAVVVSLKIRTAPVDLATSQATAATDALVSGGAEQIFFKYCSTFDSTDEGNIDPVIVLLRRLQVEFSIACPAYPELGRRGQISELDRECDNAYVIAPTSLTYGRELHGDHA
jgi:uncharacterized protein YgbK (DUF1537 family)